VPFKYFENFRPDPIAYGTNHKTQTPIRLSRNLPKVTLLISLYKEKSIAKCLIKNLCKLDYPPTHLQVIVILKDGYKHTKSALKSIEFPPWMEILQTHPDTIKTKPRALYYAFPLSTGEIIGVYDAEDALEENQLFKIPAQFVSAAPNIACLKGRLDYFNSKTNFLSRGFTLEYASWFWILLHRLAKMRILIPLGGTALFFRRSAVLHLNS
jgi:cellulose synthase/poly-beta-1,6-N-acetylglucosamine synthase-like glycosyltransferase